MAFYLDQSLRSGGKSSLSARSIIILGVYLGLHLLETGDVEHSVLEFDGHVVVLAE